MGAMNPEVAVFEWVCSVNWKVKCGSSPSDSGSECSECVGVGVEKVTEWKSDVISGG